jgi:hypothetical protein
MNQMKKCRTVVVFSLLAAVCFACGKVTFNMSGASVGNAKTCQVGFFENRADIVNPRLSTQITDALKDKIQASTSLKLVNSSADVAFEGEITGYSVTSGQVTADGVAAKDRLTVTVKVRFSNELDPDKNYDKSFSRFQEFTGGQSLSAVEGSLVDDILKEIMEDIFNEAFSSW